MGQTRNWVIYWEGFISTTASSSPNINMPVVLSTLLLYSLRTIVIYCYQLIHKDDGILGSDEPISDSNDISYCSEPLTNVKTIETEVFYNLKFA